jgi:thioredoxin reductase (NADPH)
MADTHDVLIVGAGPAGLAATIEAKRLGLDCVVLDKGAVVDSLRRFPTHMLFFTTKERLEIGGVPFPLVRAHPDRSDALAYYRQLAQAFVLAPRTFERVVGVDGKDGSFEIASETANGERRRTRARKVIVATGYFDHPNLLGIPGEDLPHASHYYDEGHAYFGREVAVIGGRNSAAEAALDLFRNGARVTLIHRGPELSPAVKYWIAPDLKNRIAEREIRALFGTRVTEIRRGAIVVQKAGEPPQTLANDFVFALTGYRPDVAFLSALGVAVDEQTLKPVVGSTFETSRPGVHAIGSVLAGARSGEIFIENGRHHGAAVIAAIANALGKNGR